MVYAAAKPPQFFKSSSHGLFPPETPEMKPLVASLPALLLVVKTVLSARAAQGDDWLAAAASSAAAIDLADVLRAAPAPVLSRVSPDYYGKSYRAALAAAGSVFDVAVTTVTTDVFVDRFLNYGDVSESVLLVALIYLDRLIATTTDIILNSSNVHKLFGIAFMLAAKWHEDEYYTPAFFARLIGLSLEEINKLERHFLIAVSHRLFVDPHDFKNAQLAFMGEAIDSPTGLSVYQRLRMFKVQGLERAAERAKTWHVVPAGDFTWRVFEDFRTMMSPASVRIDTPAAATTPTDYPPFAPLPRSKASLFETMAPLAAIARAQLEHDFPKIGYGGVWFPDAGRVYTQRGLRRRDALLLLSQGVRVNTWLPQLEYRQIPHAYLSHVMPIDNDPSAHQEDYTSPVTGSYGSTPYEYMEKPESVVTDVLYTEQCCERSNMASSWGTSGKVDWGYGNNASGTSAGGIGSIYAVPTIWTTR